jgi:hypothetical protein
MPCTPERVWKAIRDAGVSSGAAATSTEGLGGNAPRDASGQAHFAAGADENADPGATGSGADERGGAR